MALIQMNLMSKTLMRTVPVNVILPVDKMAFPGNFGKNIGMTRSGPCRYCLLYTEIYLPATDKPSTRTLGEPKPDIPGISKLEATARMFFSIS